MDLRRLRAGEWLVGISGLVLFVALFLPWYDIQEGIVFGPVDAFDASASAWDSFAVLDVLLAICALGGMAVVIVTAIHSTPAVPLALQSLLTILALVLVALVAFRLIDPPDVSFVEGGGRLVREQVDEVSRGAGAWLGLAGTLGLVVGGLVAMRDERLTRGGRHTDLTGVPVAHPKEVETLSLPRPEAGP
jgi:hypothetical protein